MPVRVSGAAGGELEGECRAFGAHCQCVYMTVFFFLRMCMSVCVFMTVCTWVPISEYPRECEHTAVQVSL